MRIGTSPQYPQVLTHCATDLHPSSGGQAVPRIGLHGTADLRNAGVVAVEGEEDGEAAEGEGGQTYGRQNARNLILAIPGIGFGSGCRVTGG